MRILVLNSGSSSQKSSLYEFGSEPSPAGAGASVVPMPPIWTGQITWSGEQDSQRGELEVHTSRGASLRKEIQVGSQKLGISLLLETLWSGETQVISGPSEIDAVGHRVVHGGERYKQPTIITPEVKSALARLAFLAPLHNRAELGGMELIEERFGPVPQVAVFDTAFHSRMPEAAAIYPGPYEWVSEGIRRYGFHGINHQYCAERTAQVLGKRLESLKIVTCHLGNGCSLAAIRDGHSIDTSMGFTPLEGLMMGTRSGSVDPGILTYLASVHSMSGQRMDELLNTESGLLGVSGVSGDMREIEEAKDKGHARAKLAFEIFVHRLQSGIGAMVAVLGGLDALVFTAGIGEHSRQVRAAACANLSYLGLKLDATKNDRVTQDADIAASDSSVRVLVVRAQEDWAIARECRRIA
ncbi:MAG TPA: acetate kinase [Candidatus Cybelea sp.]|nr:acetate kinase [Candidatus Cybelea sp.]